MHRPRHLHTVVSMRLAAGLALLSVVLFLIALATAGYALIDIDRPLLLGALGVFVAFLAALLGYRILASSARCPLCMGPILLSRACSRSKKATTLWGSFRLKVARDIIVSNRFLCPYCGEPTKCEAREKPEEPSGQPVRRQKGPEHPESW